MQRPRAYHWTGLRESFGRERIEGLQRNRKSIRRSSESTIRYTRRFSESDPPAKEQTQGGPKPHHICSKCASVFTWVLEKIEWGDVP